MEYSKYQLAFVKLIKHEGGYSDNPDDFGRETYMGISRKHNPSWVGWDIIDYSKRDSSDFRKTLPLNSKLNLEVEKFYLENYWEKLRCNDFHNKISFELFDAGVNIGKGKITKILQKSLNLLNNVERDYPDIKVDGIMGKKTVDAYERYMVTSTRRTRNQLGNINVLLKVINYFQLDTYVKIAKNRPSQEIFFYGWIKQRI